MAIKHKWSGLFGSGRIEITDPAPLWQSTEYKPRPREKRKPKGNDDA